MQVDDMTRTAIGLLSGVLCGAGLAIWGMTDPQKVQNFLDVTGAWDPSLAFVMGGALSVMAIAWRWALPRGRSLPDSGLALPTRVKIDPELLIGSAVFGAGWGLVGLCPGPALAGLLAGGLGIPLFALAMLGGAALHQRLLADLLGRRATSAAGRGAR